MAKEKKNKGFKCSNCNQWIPLSKFMGTKHRNHCPFCLWSKHVDLNKSGDRKSNCQSGMKPIAFTLKQEGSDKWGNPKQGELMLVHLCAECGKISINRIAADDDSKEILKIWKSSKKLNKNILTQLAKESIKILGPREEKQIHIQLFGKNISKV